jgi:hypothetical protein
MHFLPKSFFNYHCRGRPASVYASPNSNLNCINAELTLVQLIGRMIKTAFGYANLSPVIGCRICMLRYVIISSAMKPAVNLPQLELWCRYYFTVYRAVLRIRDAYPGSRPDYYPSGSRISDSGSRIPDTGSKNSNKREG